MDACDNILAFELFLFTLCLPQILSSVCIRFIGSIIILSINLYVQRMLVNLDVYSFIKMTLTNHCYCIMENNSCVYPGIQYLKLPDWICPQS